MAKTVNIGDGLKDLKFETFESTAEKILLSLGIIGTTVKRISESIKSGEDGPYYVYRRAAIFCSIDNSYERIIENLKFTIPVIIVLHPDFIYIHNTKYGEIHCAYNELLDHIEYLETICHSKNQRKDPYLTLELDQLVESLYRSLILDDNSKDSSRTLVFDVLYASLFGRLMSVDNINCLLESDINEDSKIQAILDIFAQYNCPHIKFNKSTRISKESAKYILSILKFDILNIDAEILCSLIYRMVSDEDICMYGHKTSILHVEKVLTPLFEERAKQIDELVTVESAYSLMNDIISTIVFDPTNSPGSFLTASYNILSQQLQEVKDKFDIQDSQLLKLDHFISINTNSLTAELTRLSLTYTHLIELSKSQSISIDVINDVFEKTSYSVLNPLLCNWGEYFTPNNNTFIVGAPQFLGSQKISETQKELMQSIFCSEKLFYADYCSAWLAKAAQTISNSDAKAAFVLTNSVTQGEQSAFIYEKIKEFGCEYSFAHTSFKWNSSNKLHEGVTVVVIGIQRANDSSKKRLYSNGNCVICDEIGSHLVPDVDVQVHSRNRVLTPFLPEMRKGNMPYCADALIFNTAALEEYLREFPESKKFVKALYGSEEFVNSSPKWCLWITDDLLEEAMNTADISARIEAVRAARALTTASEKCKNNPHKFREQFVTACGQVSIIVPTVTSENRYYFQMGIIDDKSVANNNAFVIYNGEIWLLALLESRMHMIWAKNACGGHETRPRYSNTLCYNTYPVPPLNKHHKDVLSSLSRLLIETREKFCDRSIANMYRQMPPELKQVHSLIDKEVDSIYSNRPFESDTDRLLCLKLMYNQLLEYEKSV